MLNHNHELVCFSNNFIPRHFSLSSCFLALSCMYCLFSGGRHSRALCLSRLWAHLPGSRPCDVSLLWAHVPGSQPRAVSLSCVGPYSGIMAVWCVSSVGPRSRITAACCVSLVSESGSWPFLWATHVDAMCGRLPLQPHGGAVTVPEQVLMFVFSLWLFWI